MGLSLLRFALAVLVLSTSCMSVRLRPECRFSNIATTPFVPTQQGDLRLAKPFRNYIAVTKVEPAGHHFTISYLDVEIVTARLRVTRGASGKLAIVEEGAWFGPVGRRADNATLPAEVAELAHEVEVELGRYCNVPHSFTIRYDGNYRTVDVEEFVAYSVKGQRLSRGGRSAQVTIAMDPSLTRIEHIIAQRGGGFGVILAYNADAQWVPAPEGNGYRLLLANGVPPKLVERIAAAARRFDQKTSPPSFTSLSDALPFVLPAGLATPIAVKVLLRGRRRGEIAAIGKLFARLDLHDAVFGDGSTTVTQVNIGSTLYRFRTTLVPLARRLPKPKYSEEEYAGTLLLRIEDNHGHIWQQSYTARGPISFENDTVIAPYGLGIPGSSTPSPEEVARHGQMPGILPNDIVQLDVDGSLFDDSLR